MERIYALGGIYVLNLHPERGVLCKPALERLLAFSQKQSLPVWVSSLRDVELWWRERRRFTLAIQSSGEGTWRVEATCTPRATLLGRHIEVEGASVVPWYGGDSVIDGRAFTVRALTCPCIALSPRTSQDVEDFLLEQGYPIERVDADRSQDFALYLDIPEGLGEARADQIARRSALVAQIESVQKPLVRFGVWPERARAALSITGDIDSITIQDFFLRIIEARQHAAPQLVGAAVERNPLGGLNPQG